MILYKITQKLIKNVILENVLTDAHVSEKKNKYWTEVP